MVTIKITSEKTLDTADDIAAFLREDYSRMTDNSKLMPGEAVDITNRAGLPPEIAVGDVGIVLFSEPSPSPFTHVRLLHSNGSLMTMQLQTTCLTKRDAS